MPRLRVIELAVYRVVRRFRLGVGAHIIGGLLAGSPSSLLTEGRDPRDKRVVYRLTGRAGRRGSDATPAWIANELKGLLWVHIAERLRLTGSAG
jgi:hypothetical protein